MRQKLSGQGLAFLAAGGSGMLLHDHSSIPVAHPFVGISTVAVNSPTVENLAMPFVPFLCNLSTDTFFCI